MKVALFPTTFANRLDESSHITLVLLAKELKKKGHDVCIVSEGDKRFPGYEIFEGIPVYRGPRIFSKALNKLLSPVLRARRLRKKGIKFDVIHNFSAVKFFILKAMLAKDKNTKIVHTLRSYSRSDLGNCFTRLLNLADAVTVSTRTFANNLIKRGCKKNKIRIIGSPIDIEKFKCLDKQESKRKVGIKNNFVLYYGSSYENKGPLLLIRAMRDILLKNKDWKLVMVLRHNVPKEYKKIVRLLDTERNVLFIGKSIGNIEDYVNAADIVALPYKDMTSVEGNPSCLLESMACKTPVVTTDLAELKNTVEPEKDVLMAKAGDLLSLSKEINRLVNDKRLRNKLAENAYKKSKQFDVKEISKRFISLYKSL